MQLKRVSGTNRPYQGSTSTYIISASEAQSEDAVRQYVAAEVGAIAYAKDASWYGKRITQCSQLEVAGGGADWQVVVHEPYTD